MGNSKFHNYKKKNEDTSFSCNVYVSEGTQSKTDNFFVMHTPNMIRNINKYYPKMNVVQQNRF